jgi:hypothetical protein
MEVTGLLKAATSRALAARDSLCLQLILANAKRGGDITHIRANDLDRVEIKEGYGELMVSVQC